MRLLGHEGYLKDLARLERFASGRPMTLESRNRWYQRYYHDREPYEPNDHCCDKKDFADRQSPRRYVPRLVRRDIATLIRHHEVSF